MDTFEEWLREKIRYEVWDYDGTTEYEMDRYLSRLHILEVITFVSEYLEQCKADKEDV